MFPHYSYAHDNVYRLALNGLFQIVKGRSPYFGVRAEI